MVDEDGHSLVDGPLVPGSELRFEPFTPVLYTSKSRSQFAVYGYLADTFLIYSTSVKPIRRGAPQTARRG